jgi:hypothetical protein
MAVANGSGQGLLRLCGRSRGVALIEAGSVATVGSRRAGIRADATCWPVLPSAGRAVFRAWNRCWRASGQPSRCQDPDMARVHGCAWRVRRTVRRQPRKRLKRRTISKLLLADPLPLSESASVELVELIPPFHQRVYRMGLEHVGFVVGADLNDFSRRHRAVLTG